MKTKKRASVFFLLFNILLGFSQQKMGRQLREERKLEKQKQIEMLVNSKEFLFVANKASSQGFSYIDLTNNPNFIKFKPDFIKSDMPFFGRAFSGIDYGGWSIGLHFEGKPERFTVEKVKKTYQVNVSVKGINDYYNITLTVSLQGSTSLTITSNNRNSILYLGEITPIIEQAN